VLIGFGGVTVILQPSALVRLGGLAALPGRDYAMLFIGRASYRTESVPVYLLELAHMLVCAASRCCGISAAGRHRYLVFRRHRHFRSVGQLLMTEAFAMARSRCWRHRI